MACVWWKGEQSCVRCCRKHAEIVVPSAAELAAEGEAPYVLVKGGRAP